MTAVDRPDGAGAAHPRVDRRVDKLAAYSWRLLVIGAAAVGLLWVVRSLLVVVIPVAVALILTRGLWPVRALLHRYRLPEGLAALVTLLAFLAAVGAVSTVVSRAVASELDELGPTLSSAVDDVGDWLVDNGPGDITHDDVRRWRAAARDQLESFVGSGSGSVVSGAMVAAEILVGFLLALVVTFFLLKDGERIAGRALGLVSDERRERATRAGRRAWDALGGYLRGAALLGVVEALVIGIAAALAGSDLVLPIMLVTFVAAFVPIVGAIVAGIVAVLVTLATAGVAPALIVAAVALVVQQVDNDLLAPFVYGRTLQLHPLVVLLGIAAGSAVGGLIGAVFAVPVLATTIGAAHELLRDPDPTT